MKLFIHITTILVLLSRPVYSQWQWALSADYNSASTGSGSHVLMHPNGNIVCTGSYSGGLALDNLYFSSINGSQFTAEYTPEGVPVRSFTIKETSAQGGANIFQFTRDSRGNMYYAGDIRGGVYFDTTLVNVGPNGYIVSIDTAFKYRWHKKVGDIVYALSFDSAGNTFVMGDITSSANSIDTFIMQNADGVLEGKMYVAKLDTLQQCVWLKYASGRRSNLLKSATTGNNLYAFGFIDSCTTFDNYYSCQATNTIFNINMTKSDSIIDWCLQYDKLNNGWFKSVGTDDYGNCIVVGGLDSDVYIGTDTLVKYPNSTINSFVLKCDSDKKILWAEMIPGSLKTYATHSYTNATGYTYIAGTFSDSIFLYNTRIKAQSAEDMFITRFSPQGQCLGIVTVPNAQPRSVTQDASGNAIVTGHIGPGNSQFGNITLSSPGAKNFFLAKLNALNGTSSITTIPDDGLLSIYANPNAGMFTVAVPEALVNTDNIQLLIYGTLGELIKAEVANNVNNLLSVNLGNVKRGIYTVALQSGNKRYTGKVVVE